MSDLKGYTHEEIVLMVEDEIDRIINDAMYDAYERIASDLKTDPESIEDIYNQHMATPYE